MTKKQAIENLNLSKKYLSFVEDVKQQIQKTRIQISCSANRGLIELYWWIGQQIVERQIQHGWGKAIVERLAEDLRHSFTTTLGFSARNLWDMRHFYLEYKDYPNLRQLVAEIPWGQNLVILAKVKDPKAREYYLSATKEMGWTRDIQSDR